MRRSYTSAPRTPASQVRDALTDENTLRKVSEFVRYLGKEGSQSFPSNAEPGWEDEHHKWWHGSTVTLTGNYLTQLSADEKRWYKLVREDMAASCTKGDCVRAGVERRLRLGHGKPSVEPLSGEPTEELIELGVASARALGVLMKEFQKPKPDADEIDEKVTNWIDAKKKQ